MKAEILKTFITLKYLRPLQINHFKSNLKAVQIGTPVSELVCL